MKFTLALLIVAAVLGCVLSCSEQDFKDYQVKFNKSYPNKAEELRRMDIFCKALDSINAHNKLFEEGKTSYTQGVNQFTDMTQDEFAGNYLGLLRN